jgi:hypothetical protein
MPGYELLYATTDEQDADKTKAKPLEEQIERSGISVCGFGDFSHSAGQKYENTGAGSDIGSA